MKLTDRIFHIISNTHWDREWRFPFQINRQMLVNMMDQLLDILEKEPRYRAFHLDSQSIVIEDYLEIKPQKRELISKFVKEKRLFVGPWYVLPDEFQVGGENLIRNLLIGHKISNEIGRVSKVGYSPFSWGQISQLPQIYKEFGIDFVMFYRGVNSLDSPKAEFIWEGVDGTQVLASRFSTMPRYNFYFYIYRPVLFNEFPTNIEFNWNRESLLFHFADLNLFKTDYFNPKPANEFYSENLKPQIEKIINDQVNDFTTPHVIWMEGHDSSGPNVNTVKLIDEIKKYFPELKIIHSTLEDYSEAVKNSVDKSKLKIVKGERRSTQYDSRSGNLYGYTISARMDLKIMNFDCERWLQFYAEPFYNFASLLGLDIEDRYLELAWKLLVQNSSHDSIGGCSLDVVHEDMINRYKQIKEISSGLFSKACQHILSKGDFINKQNPEENYLFCINPTNYQRNEVAQIVVDIPIEFDQGGFKLVDSNSNEMDVQIIKSEKSNPVLEQLIDRPMYVNVKRYFAYASVKSIPFFGFKNFKIIPSENQRRSKEKIGKIAGKKIILENTFLKVSINPNGTLKLYDKRTGYVFDKLAYFFDEGESGHAWVHKSEKPVIISLKSKPKIKILENGPLAAKVLIEHRLKIPSREIKIISGRKIKAKSFSLPIRMMVNLTKESKRVDLDIEIINTGENHRLRIIFPTLKDAKYHFAEGQFDVVQREVKRIDARDWIEPPMYDFPMHHFVDVIDEKKGLAILVDGLKEYEVHEDENKTLAVTLLRSFSYVIAPSSVEEFLEMKGSQCPGKHKFRLSIYPHSGNWIEGKVYEEALKFSLPLTFIETNNITTETLNQKSFLKIQPDDLVFSCFKKSEDSEGFILRLYNPTNRIITGKIEFFWKIKSAELVTLEEKSIQKLDLTDNKIHIDVQPKKIITIKLKFES